MLVHSVYFWLKPRLAASKRAGFRAEVEKLAAIPTVGKIYIGAPAALAERSVTDRSFDLALTLLFKSADDHDAYQVHPIHVAFVKRNQASWTRVQVYDSGG
jgi:hypothetical protein